MTLLLRAILTHWILGKLALRGLMGVLLLAPIASLLKLAGLPLLAIVAVAGVPLFLFLAKIGLPAMLAVGMGALGVAVIILVVVVGGVLLNVLLAGALVAWIARRIWRGSQGPGSPPQRVDPVA